MNGLGNYEPKVLFTEKQLRNIYKKYLRKPDTSGKSYTRFINRRKQNFVEAVKDEYKEREDFRAKYTYKDFLKLRRSETPPFSYEDWKSTKENLYNEAVRYFEGRRKRERLTRQPKKVRRTMKWK